MATYKPRLVLHGLSMTWTSDTRPGSTSIGGTSNKFPGPGEGFIGINTGSSLVAGSSTAVGRYPRLEFFCSTGSTDAPKWWQLTCVPTSAGSTVMCIVPTTCQTT